MLTRIVCLALLLGACSGPPPDASDAAPVAPAPQAPVDAAPPPAPPLDLSRDAIRQTADEFADSAEATVGDAPDVLPDLFEGDGSDADKVKVSGSVLTDEEATTLRDRVDGVELKVKVPTR